MAANDPSPDYEHLLEDGFLLAIGLLLMGYAANAVFWYSYQQANPAVGDVSSSFGFLGLHALLFIVGTVVAYVAFVRGLAAAGVA